MAVFCVDSVVDDGVGPAKSRLFALPGDGEENLCVTEFTSETGNLEIKVWFATCLWSHLGNPPVNLGLKILRRFF